jgi:hypothetical protein
MMKAVGAAIIVLVGLYFVDQLLAQGKYTDAARFMAGQIRHSTGIYGPLDWRPFHGEQDEWRLIISAA